MPALILRPREIDTRASSVVANYETDSSDNASQFYSSKKGDRYIRGNASDEKQTTCRMRGGATYTRADGDCSSISERYGGATSKMSSLEVGPEGGPEGQ